MWYLLQDLNFSKHQCHKKLKGMGTVVDQERLKTHKQMQWAHNHWSQIGGGGGGNRYKGYLGANGEFEYAFDLK